MNGSQYAPLVLVMLDFGHTQRELFGQDVHREDAGGGTSWYTTAAEVASSPSGALAQCASVANTQLLSPRQAEP